jgi:hypothetical protein
MTKISNLVEFGDTILKQTPYNVFVFENKTLVGGKPMSLAELDKFTLDLPAEDYKNIWIKPSTNKPSVLYALNNGEKATQEYKSDEASMTVIIPSKARQTAETAFLGNIPKSVRFSGGQINFSVHDGWWEGELPCNEVITVRY